MRNSWFQAFCVSLLLVAFAGQADAWLGVPKYDIDYIRKAAEDGRLINRKVATQGLVIESEAIVPQPGEPPYKGKYVLQDVVTGDRIGVRTTRRPPATNTYLKRLVATVEYERAPAGTVRELVLVQRGDQQLWLYAAIGVLAIVAVVLVVMLIRPPTERGPQEDAQILCPSCGAPNEVYANHCEICGGSMSGEVKPPDLPEPPPTGPEPAPEVGTARIATPYAEMDSRKTVRIMPEEDARPIADLVIVEGPGGRTGTRLGLRGSRQKIGRDPNAVEIVLHDETVSREHAMIWQEGDTFYLQDLASTAGTFVNGNRITREALNDGDEIELGRTKLVFRAIAAKRS